MSTRNANAQDSLDWFMNNAYEVHCQRFQDGSEDVDVTPFDDCILEDTAEPLQELINKAEAVEPSIEADGFYGNELVYDTWICPNCGKRYEIEYDRYDYCPKCGQHIDTKCLEKYR